VEWWIGAPDGKKLRRLDDPKTGRARVRPVNQTVVLKRDDASLTLLGPDGGDLKVSLNDGPIAKTALNDQFTTTFSFTPDGKNVAFVNGTGAVCRFAIGSKDLVVAENSGVDPSRGLQFSPDGARLLYAKYFRKDDFSPVMFSVYAARSDATGEKKLAEYQDGRELGYGFLPDGRVGLVGPTSLRAIDPVSGKVEQVAGPWKTELAYRAFGGFNPDGSTFLFDRGGPYQLDLFACDVKTGNLTTVKSQYLESFQRMVWVRAPAKP
jgi:Tol biopolymer transport system component